MLFFQRSPVVVFVVALSRNLIPEKMLVDMHSIIILLLSDRIITLLRSAKSNIRFPNRENFNKQDYASIFYLLILFS